ncbi:uncharacterized protein B0I36DRAFT_348165 [Microdochium trichocladiopsis]|uniref:Uncharacterized protein n=1 Tax=Microdochium trichocladiopsis TaxID=1682393 RepID=A0A9P8Y9H8_9PEZI|nr:uncharacterized protein B0I36DRAFT_348165 [Microdochium trichocladiopsis]KAH7033046.1 hypothetical protein B0I36DRAFT_348165 [Microdochium trichocladiopsis]
MSLYRTGSGLLFHRLLDLVSDGSIWPVPWLVHVPWWGIGEVESAVSTTARPRLSKARRLRAPQCPGSHDAPNSVRLLVHKEPQVNCVCIPGKIVDGCALVLLRQDRLQKHVLHGIEEFLDQEAQRLAGMVLIMTLGIYQDQDSPEKGSSCERPIRHRLKNKALRHEDF